METYKPPQSKKKFNKTINIVLLILAIILISSVVEMYPKSRRAVVDRDLAKQNLTNSYNERDTLKNQVESLETKEGQEPSGKV